MSQYINTGSIVAALRPGVNTWAGLEYKDLSPEWSQIFSVYQSHMAYEKDAIISSFPLPLVKPEGQSVNYTGTQQFITPEYKHITYDLGAIISREAIEDNLYKELAEKRTRNLVRSMNKGKEIICANILNNASNSSFTMTGGDGVSLANSAHPLGRGGTYSNVLLTPSPLSEITLENALVQMSGYVDDANIIINAQPRKMVVHRNLLYEAERLCQSNYQYNTANNAINAMKYMGKLPEGYVVNHYLTNVNAWFVLSDVEDGLKVFERRPIQVDVDTDFDTENLKIKATMRFVPGWTDSRAIISAGY